MIERVTNGEAENELEESAEEYSWTEALGRQQARGGTEAGATIRQGDEEGATQGTGGCQEGGTETDGAETGAETDREKAGRSAAGRGGVGRHAAHGGARGYRRRARPAGESRNTR